MTKEQIEMLERFRSGGTFSEWDGPDGDLMRYLLSTGRIKSERTVMVLDEKTHDQYAIR